MSQHLFRITLLGVSLYCTFAFMGCGTVREGGYEADNATPVSMTARLEYRVDSLVNENRRLQQQLDAVQKENKNLNTRLTEIQTKPAEPIMRDPVVPQPISSASTGRLPAAYDNALLKFRNKDYQDSIEEFKSLLAGGVSSDLADNCEYWIGESYFAMKKYTDAIESFKTVTRMDGADKADDAQLMIGNAYTAMGDKPAAKEAFQKLIMVYPSSPLVPRARTRMNAL